MTTFAPLAASRTAAQRSRYAELTNHVRSLVADYAACYDHAEEAHLLGQLDTITAELAQLSLRANAGDVELVRRDSDNARFAHLLADAAAARHHRRPRRIGLLPELDALPYARFVLNQLAGQSDQPGWVLALRLNALIDHAIAAGLRTDLAQALALTASHRPDGENAAEHEQADHNNRCSIVR